MINAIYVLFYLLSDFAVNIPIFFCQSFIMLNMKSVYELLLYIFVFVSCKVETCFCLFVICFYEKLGTKFLVFNM